MAVRECASVTPRSFHCRRDREPAATSGAAYAAVMDKAARVRHVERGAEDEESAPARIYLAGRVCIENRGVIRDETALPGRQGRLLFCFLVLNQALPIARHQLVNAVWGEREPEALDASLNALVSKLRRYLDGARIDGATALEGSMGSYRLQLPPGSWVDIDQAEHSFHEAEGAARKDDMPALYVAALVAGAVARRPFLAGENLPWVVAQRERLRTVLVRTLDYRSDFYRWHGEPDVALKLAQEAVAVEPFRETGHQRLMRLLRDQGNRAEALRAYERCRRLLRDELGVNPSPETEALYLTLLKAN